MPLLYMLLEIRFRKNLAKLTGSAVRIKSKKPKGKKTMKEKKTKVVTRDLNAHPKFINSRRSRPNGRSLREKNSATLFALGFNKTGNFLLG